MSSPRDYLSSAHARTRLVRAASFCLVAIAALGLVALNTTKQAADAASATSSAVTVKWTGDVGQPIRDDTSPHFAEFSKLAITVSQTQGIVDQAIKVGVTGFAGTITASDNSVKNAMNYLQAMQCWGDPTAANFRQTCQWGGRYVENNGLGSSAFIDNTLRVASRDLDTATLNRVDNPFLTVQGRSVSGLPQLINKTSNYAILDYFNAATSNEVTSARVGADGSGSFDFETQTSDQAPQLGCGTADHLRCYLVVVPRGTVFGGNGEECSSIRDRANNDSLGIKGRSKSLQGGSPMNPGCDYWDNRVVIPLDFQPTGNTCAVGSAEQRVVGSQLMVGAMSSWQPDLCSKQKTTYSFATNPDVIARHQLLEGTASVAYSSFPLSPGELTSNDDRDVLAKTKLSYAPVAISGVAVAFLGEFDSGRQTKLNLSPRLMAKLLTQSYPFQIPTSSQDEPSRAIAHLDAVNRKYRYVNQDPEFQKLNPSTWPFFSQNPGIVVPGPAGADAIRQLWRWIIADSDAAAFLSGEPDPSGMKVNPYYLPAGSAKAVVPTFQEDGTYALNPDGSQVFKAVGLANVDGTALKLAQIPLDTFIKADRTLAPLKLQKGQRRFDSIQYAPYTENLLSAARAGFRADPNSKSVWDPSRINSSGDVGDWVSSGAQTPGQKFMIAITDTPSAERYGLDTVALKVANTESFVEPTQAAFTAALTALQPTSNAAVFQVDPSKVTAKGYPLTTVTYAEVNLTRSTAVARKNIANLLDQVTTTGQVVGTSPGQLPAGYLPITSAMAAQSATAAKEIRAFVNSTDALDTTSNGIAQDEYTGGSGSAFDDSGAIADGGATAVDPIIAPTAIDKTGKQFTSDLPQNLVARSGLALSLGVGAAGVLFAPILFKRRGFL
ncbi:MAG: hypothetical protein H7201_16745 [Candidatus Saccharibacteria bacterium]|nr:hypothetical protein [Microbacteriaceae bacterium]